MCSTCGCGESDVRLVTLAAAEPDADAHGRPHDHPHEHPHDHPHEHPHDHPHDHAGGHDHLHLAPDAAPRTHTLDLEVAVLAKNDELAAGNREWLAEHGITALNVMSSPGSGKTTLLERTIGVLDRPVTVVEGDQETLLDAQRIRAAGARVVQINTGAGCHLDAAMVGRALEQLRPERGSILFIENVGNLVCPALFDLGEARRVVVISVTEGDDKPLKYPHMFAAADLVVVNKTDLLPHVDFDTERLVRDARRINPGLAVLPLSARTGESFETWLDYLAGVFPP
jgi:hydrogenase nickel incorporation protein HypB